MVAPPAKISRLNKLQWAAIDRARQRWPQGVPAGFFDVLVASLEAAGAEEGEVLLCGLDPHYFFATALKIYDAQAADWIPFDLWAEQAEALELIHTNQLTIALKARQLGMTWLALGYALWQMLFRPIATVLLFSRRDDEAMYLLSDERLKGMYNRLPEYLKKRATIATDNAHQLKFSNGSVAYAFPTTAGDSYTATFVIMDEADLLPNLNKLMGSVKPTIDAGGKLFMLSRVDKSQPNSEFKRIYKAAKEGKNGWASSFLSWNVRPERTLAWYEAQKRDILSRTGSLDALWEQYPSTDTEALMPKTLDKRISPEWLMQCHVKQTPLDDADAPAIPGLVIYQKPFQHRVYVAGADPAEGNPTSDDSAATWLDAKTGEEVAKLNGKLEPSVFASYIDQVCQYFNHANVLVERNNHGHAVLLWLELNSNITCSEGPDEKAGWLDNSLGKTRLYDHCADMFRDRATVIHSEDTYYQLSSIDGSTLRAPVGELDDLSDSYALALMGMVSAFSLNFFIGKARF